MNLLKDNPSKHRTVYSDHHYVKKHWRDKTVDWMLNHIKILDLIRPNYVKGCGIDSSGVYILFDILPGTLADTYPHTDDFIRTILNYCLELNESTKPFYHGDWVLSNMLIDSDNTIRMCDWDNVGLHTIEEVKEKLYSDLYSAFGDRFKEIYDDTTSI